MRVLRVLILSASLLPSLPAVSVAQPAQAPECRTWQTCRDAALEARAAQDYERFQDLAWRAVRLGPANDPGLMYLLARAQALGGRPQDSLVTLERLIARGIATEAAMDVDFERARRLSGWPEIAASLARIAEAGSPSSARATPPPSERPAAEVSPPPAVAPASPPARAPERAPSSADSSPSAASGARVPASPRPPASPRVPVPSRAPASPGAPASPREPASTDPVPAASAGLSATAAAGALKIDRRPVEEVSRFSSPRFHASGLAYDAVSGRFLFGDAGGQRVMVLGDGLTNAVDLARAAGAGFNDVTAFEIDARRGDLWVASTASDRSKGAVHRLQLISGRAISTVESPAAWQSVDLIDLAIVDPTTILVLDRSAPRLAVFRSGAKALDELMPIAAIAPASLTTSDARTAYVAHRDGILRLDLQQGKAAPVTAAPGIFLGGFERIRWHRNGLAGVQNLPDGTRQIVRLDLTRGRNVTAATVLADSVPQDSGPALATLSGDDLYFLTMQPSAASAAQMDFVVRRVRLP